jgi:hypothetical protein
MLTPSVSRVRVLCRNRLGTVEQKPRMATPTLWSTLGMQSVHEHAPELAMPADRRVVKVLCK